MNQTTNNYRRTALSIAALFSMTLSVPALAHGDQAHAKLAQTTVKKEQKDWGIAGEAKDAKRTIQIGMSDTMRFTPDKVAVKQGETVKFVITNKGKIMHEYVIGTKTDLDAHAAMMVKFPTMEHDEPYMAHVAPGKKGEIVWTFNQSGDFDFACLIAGHYQAGMVGKISVRGAKTAATELKQAPLAANNKPAVVTKAAGHSAH